MVEFQIDSRTIKTGTLKLEQLSSATRFELPLHIHST